MQKQRPAQYQGLYLVAPDGKVLASHQNFKSHKTWAKELIADLEPGLKAFGPVTPREVRPADPFPDRGVGLLSGGGARLAVFLRFIYKGAPLAELPNPTLDSLVLSAEELKALAPPDAKPGRTWEVPEKVARQFSRVLGPGDENSMPRPNEVTTVRFTGKVVSVEGGVAVLSYTGAAAGSHKTQSGKFCSGEVKLTGVGRYDVKSGRLAALTWVFDGTFRNVKPYDQPARYAGVVEWRR